MTVVQHHLMQSNPHHLGDVWHVYVSKDGRGSPADDGYDGGFYKMDGMSQEKAVRLLRRLADMIEQGKSMAEIAFP